MEAKKFLALENAGLRQLSECNRGIARGCQKTYSRLIFSIKGAILLSRSVS